jgi:hypothetical protein
MATIDIFNLSPRDFNLQMQEEAMYRTPAELDELRREYRNRNSMAGKLMGLLAPEEGKRRSTFLPVDAPQGMSIFDALRSGQATPAVPQGLVDLITGGTRGVESAREYAQGVPPRADALNDALAMAGLAMTGGGLAVSTLRPTKPSLPSAPKERGDMILNMLKEGEAANITDDMFDMGDSVKTTQLNQYLFENYDLPMDAESRAQRLFQMGYRREGMHGTSKETAGTTETPDILAFRPSTAGAYGRGVYVDPVRDGDIGASRYYAEPRGREAGTSGTYYPLLTKGKLIEKGSYDDEYFKALDDVAKANPKESDQARATTEDAMNRLAEQRVSEQGFAGVGGAGEYTIFDPANIRSRSARADPRLAHLSDIMAANASKSAGLLTTASGRGPKKEELDPLGYQKPKMRGYLSDTDVQMSDTGENLPRQPMSWEDMEGKVVLPFYGDRTARGLLVEGVNDLKFDEPVYTEGGVDFMRGPAAQQDRAIWASNQSIIKRIESEAEKASRDFEGADIFGLTGSMSPDANDFATFTGAAMAELVKGAKITKKSAKEFDKVMRAIDPDFVGVLSPKLREWVTSTSSPKRKSFIRLMESAPMQEQGFPSPAEARYSVTDPTQRDMPAGMFGLGAAKIDTSAPLMYNEPKGNLPRANVPHSTYNTQIAGDYAGSLPPVPQGLLFRNVYDAMEGKTTKSGQALNEAHKTHAIKTIMPTQQITPEVLEGILDYLSRMER